MKTKMKNVHIDVKKFLKELIKINRRKLKNGSNSMLITVLLVAVVVVINLIVAEIPEEYTLIDVSTQKLYTISDETREFLDGLDQDVTIYHIVQSGSEDSVVVRMLNRYDEYSDHVTVETKDPVLYPNFTSQYTDEEVADNSLIVVSGERSKVISYGDLYEMEYDYYTGSSSTTDFDGEGQIDSAISYVTTEDLPIIYTLEGHGEVEMGTQMTDNLERANYQVESLNLLSEESVPEDTGCLLIASPQTDLTEDEADKVIEYLQGGGKALIFADYTTEDLPNFERILENYGITPGGGIVMENDTSHYISQLPYYLLPNIESTDFTSDLISDSRYVLMAAAQSLDIMDSYRDTLEITPVLTTSEDAYEKTDVENMTTFQQEDGDQAGQFNLGLMVTETVDEANDLQTQLVCFGSYTLMDDQTNSQVTGGNQDLVLAAIDWMCENDTPVISVATKSLMMEYLTVPEYDAGYWSLITIGVIPAVFLLIGAVIWFKRRKQ